MEDAQLARTVAERSREALRNSEERYRVLAAERERLYRQQLDIAESLQLALLNIPSEIGPLRIGHLYRSATEAAKVGGDFYDVFDVKGGKAAVLIGDVSGHGIEAARTATLVKDVVHAFIHEALRPHQVLKRTNALLVEKNLPGFVTVFVAVLDTPTGLLRFASAGHPEALLRRTSGEVQLLGSGSLPLGVFADATWKNG
jgi:phosphoserine phosphatase RsbU/P